MSALTTTEKTQMSANTPTSWAKKYRSEIEKRLDEIDDNYKRAEAERAKEAEKARKIADIKRLGGLRQYEDFTAEKYTNKRILALLNNYPKENYYLWGTAGTGKTHAAVATARKVQNAQLIRLSYLSRLFRQESFKTEDEERYFEHFSKLPIILDDLGSEKMTEFLQNILFEIMDRRWSNKTGGLIITANMNIPSLAKIVGDRTASRIAGLIGAANVVLFEGKDQRLK